MSIPIYQIALLSCGLALVGVQGAIETPGEPGDKTAAWSKSIRENLQEFFTTMNKVETLEAKLKDVKPRALFSAVNPTSALGDSVPHPADTVLIFKKVFANVGNVYSEGIFTAPESGAYFFTFMFHSQSRKSPLTGLSLFKNGDRVINSGHSVEGREMVATPHHNSAADFIDHGGNSVILHLEKGDTVFIVIDEDMSIWGDENGHNTFSGFHLSNSVM